MEKKIPALRLSVRGMEQTAGVMQDPMGKQMQVLCSVQVAGLTCLLL